VTGALTEAAAHAAITAATRTLALPTIRAEAGPLADAAARDQLTHRGYLAEVLTVEVDARDTRRRQRRRKQARFPRIKTLEAFDPTAAAPGIEPAVIATLAAGAWIDRGEPVVLLGDSGRG
jgi:DNA replication protein DnaC